MSRIETPDVMDHADFLASRDFKVPEDVWLVGKGLSLDTFDWSAAGPCRVAVNETAFVVPEVFAAAAWDIPVLDKYRNGHDHHEALPSTVWVIRFVSADRPVWFPRERQFPCLFALKPDGQRVYGTGTQTLVALAGCGARHFHMVGFDSVDGNVETADSVTKIGGKGHNYDKYKRINHSLREWIKKLGLTIEWCHAN